MVMFKFCNSTETPCQSHLVAGDFFCCSPSQKCVNGRCVDKNKPDCPEDQHLCNDYCIPKTDPCCSYSQKPCNGHCINNSECCPSCPQNQKCYKGTCCISTQYCNGQCYSSEGSCCGGTWCSQAFGECCQHEYFSNCCPWNNGGCNNNTGC